MDKITGFLEVGLNDAGEVVVNHPDLKPDENGVGHIVFSANQARDLSQLLDKYANRSEQAACDKREAEARKKAESVPVDRDCMVLTDGSPVTPDHREINPVTGQQKAYVVLSEAERKKGFVRPVRRSYVHKTCRAVTIMGIALAETYARDPSFYSGTFCAGCRAHFPLEQFLWDGTDEAVGS